MLARLWLIPLTLALFSQPLLASLTIENGEVFSLSNNETLVVNGDVTINSSGTLNGANNSQTRITGNWQNDGTYTANSNSTYFTGSGNSQISGDSSFYDFIVDRAEADTGNKSLTFAASSTQTITNNLIIDGQSSGNEILIRSTTPGTQFNAFDIGAASTVQVAFVDVQDAVAVNGNIDSLNSIDSGNTFAWFGASSLLTTEFWPSAGANNVSFTSPALAIKFSSDVETTDTGNLVVRNGNGQIVANLPINANTVNIDNDFVVIELPESLSPNTDFTAQLDADSFQVSGSGGLSPPTSATVNWSFRTITQNNEDPKSLSFNAGTVPRDSISADLLDPNGDGDNSDSLLSALLANVDNSNRSEGFASITGQTPGALVTHRLDVRRDDGRLEIYLDTDVPSDNQPNILWDVDANQVEKVNLFIESVTDTRGNVIDVSSRVGFPVGSENAQPIDSSTPIISGSTSDVGHEFVAWGYAGGEYQPVTQLITSTGNNWTITSDMFTKPLDLGDNWIVLRGSTSLPLPVTTPASIRLTKVANRKEISVGGIVTYTITAENISSIDLENVLVVDDIPPGFKYLEGSAHLKNSADAEPIKVIPDGIGGGVLTFDFGDINKPSDPNDDEERINLIKTLRYQLVVGTGVNFGKYKNTAVATQINGDDEASLSAPAIASVDVVPDALFDLSTVIGKVFNDQNGNGIQDPGEGPIPFVKLVTASGKVITSDQDGQFHIGGVAEGRQAIRIDERTLPEGSTLISRKVKIVDISPGLPAKANFAVQLPENYAAKTTLDRLRYEVKADIEPVLNAAVPTAAILAPDKTQFIQPVQFYLNSNYAAFFDSWAIEIMEPRTKRVIKTFSGNRANFFSPILWYGDQDTPYNYEDDSTLLYRLTVIDTNGLRDTTLEQEITIKGWQADRDQNTVNKPSDIWLFNQSLIDETDDRQIPVFGEGIELFGDTYRFIRIKRNGTPWLIMPIYGNGEITANDLLADKSNMTKREQAVAQIILPKGQLQIDALSNNRVFNFDSTDSIVVDASSSEFGQSRTVIDSIPDEHFAVILANFTSLDEAELFLYTFADTNSLIINTTDEDKNIYSVILGFYATQLEAKSWLALFKEKNTTIEGDIVRVSVLKQLSLSDFVPAANQQPSAMIADKGEPVPLKGPVTPKTRAMVLDPIISTDLPVSAPHIIASTTVDIGATKETDLFLVAMIDAEVGYRDVKGNIETATAGDDRFDEKVWKDGRVALYLKGTIKGKYLITANYDSERETEDLFREIDPDEIYPIYGDDSITEDLSEDAYGKLYLLVEWDNSSATWGKYSTALTETDLARFDRNLQGAKLDYQSVETTDFGDPITSAIAFDARTRQKSAQNEFLATGGSLYYLRHQDVIEDSLSLTVQVRDIITGNVIETRALTPIVDYDLDGSAGRIIFSRPVDRFVSSGLLTSANTEQGNAVYLVANYNYAVIDDLDKGITGGRVKQAVTDKLSIGATYVTEDKEAGEYILSGADTTIRLNKDSKLTLEYAETESLGLDRHVSTDGGLKWAIDNSPTIDEQLNARDEIGRAWSIKGDSRLLDNRVNVEYYYQQVEDNFAADATIHQTGKEAAGFDITAGLTDNTSIRYKRDSQWLLEPDNLESAEARQQLGRNEDNHTDIVQLSHTQGKLTLTGEYRSQRFDDPLSTDNLADPSEEAFIEQDNQLMAVEARYQWNESTELLAAQQLTRKGEDNDQTALGVRKQLSERLNLGATGITGDKGDAIDTEIAYQVAEQFTALATIRQGSLGDKTIVGGNYTPDQNKSYRLAVEKIEKSEDLTSTGSSGTTGSRNDIVFGSTHKFADGYTIDQDSSITVSGPQERNANSFKLNKDLAKGRSIYTGYTNYQQKDPENTSDGNEVEIGGNLSSNWAAYVKAGKGYVNRLDGNRDRRTNTGFGLAYVRLDPASGKTLMQGRFSMEQVADRGEDDRDTQLIQLDGRGKLNEDWSLFTEIDWGRSVDKNTDEVTARNNRFDFGFAYRPVSSDKLNLLGKYSWVDNEAPDEQESITGLEADKGHVLATDILYQLNNQWLIGSKLAYRKGEEKIIDLPWAESNTWLAAIKGGYSFNQDTIVSIEFRRLDQKQAQDYRDGYVLELSRRFNDSIEAAAGYNHSGFNDDLGDLDYTVKGFYIRVTGVLTE